MGEISFNYRADTEPAYEAAFKYWFSESIEYSFAYQRYIAFSDASIFNSPVAITKVAPGLCDLRELFAERTVYFGMTENILNGYSKDKSNAFTKQGISGESNTERYGETDKILTGIGFRNGIDINEIPICQTDDKSINIYQNITSQSDSKRMNIFESFQPYGNHKELNIYQHYIAEELFDDKINLAKDIFGLRDNNVANIIKTSTLAKANINTTNIFENTFASTFNLILNVYRSYFGGTNILTLNALEQVSLKPSHQLFVNYIKTESAKPRYPLNLNTFDRTFLSKPMPEAFISSTPALCPSKDMHLNIYDIVSLQKPMPEATIGIPLLGVKKYRNMCTIKNQAFGYRYGNELSQFNNLVSFFTSKKKATDDITITIDLESKRVFCEQQYSICKNIKPLYEFDLDTFVVSEKKQTLMIEGVYLTHEFRYIDIGNVYELFKNKKHGFETYISSLTLNNKETGIEYVTVALDKSNKSIDDLYTEYFVDKNPLSVRYDNEYYFVSKNPSNLFTCNKLIGYNKNHVFMDTLDIYMVPIKKDNHSITVYDSGVDITKDKISFVQGNIPIGMNKKTRDLYQYLCNSIWLQKDAHELCCTNIKDLIASRKSYEVSIFKKGQSLIKGLIKFDSISDFSSIVKNHIPADYVNTLYNDFAGMIIPVSKTRYQSYIDNIDIMVQKTVAKGFLSHTTTASVLSKDTMVNIPELSCDKKERDIYIEYKNVQIAKDKLYTMINKDNIFIQKKPHLASSEAQIWINKTLASIWIGQGVNASKRQNNAFIEDAFNIARTSLESNGQQDSLFVDKSDKMCYYDYGFTWADKEALDLQIQTQLQLYKENKSTHMFDNVSPLIKKELKTFYEYGVFGNKFILESDLFKQLSDIHNTTKSTNILPNDFGNWAWVYETPDPFDGDKFGIDELLLPENDTRYEDFEDIIFDKEQMRPRNPVKEIDDTTFVAKYPIRHPLPKYSNIAIEYDESAVKIEQFYGIETSVMHAVFLKFYRIWQSKIFEFGTMTMVQSVKQMLEYMYSWIMEYFPLEQLEQALRVFKLIRWYGETSIIQNSQYIISYEYGTLESKLNTGKCLIPNDLDINDSMYVDAALGIIRNNPAYIGIQDAYVTFEIDNRKNTTFTFSLSNTVGSVNIYINDTLVDTVSKSALNLTYPLSYTGDINTVKIEKIASHNLNKTFFIGNLKVPNSTFKNLSIEFDPTLKAGNKPLNEIARKMISYANFFDNKEEAYEFIKKGNLGVSEIYKRLTEYWKIHHQGKTKGKRLTIKEI